VTEALALLASLARTGIRLPFALFFSAGLFAVGVYGVLARRNAVLVLMSIELMLNAVNVNLVAFSQFLQDTVLTGQVFALFVITVAAAEVGIGLAIVILIYRNRETINVDEVNLLKW
jgi:NAD(P)H-quinone oxidoreductase subunit 4L